MRQIFAGVRLALRVAIATLLGVSTASAGTLRAWDQDFSDAFPFAVIQDIDPASGAVSVPAEHATCPPGAISEPNTVFSGGADVGFVAGLTSIDGTLYALDLDPTPPANADFRLATIEPLPGSGCAGGFNVDENQAIGFFNLESLAYCEDDASLYSVDFDFASPHEGQLIKIDIQTGAGEAVSEDHMRPDLRIIGLECRDGVLWGLTSGFGVRDPELVTIDRTSGLATIIGLTGTPVSSGGAPVLESLAIDPKVQGVGLVAAGPDFYAIDSDSGAATMVGSGPRTAWALATIAVPEPGAALLGLAAFVTLAGLKRPRIASMRSEAPS